VQQNIFIIDLWAAGATNAVLEGMALQALRKLQLFPQSESFKNGSYHRQCRPKIHRDLFPELFIKLGFSDLIRPIPT
jgi:hypothetical protein